MKLIHDPTDLSVKKLVKDIPPGSVIINGEGNLCLVMRSTSELEAYNKVRMVNIENGGNYTVNGTCQYEVVDATVTWKRIVR